MVQRIAYGALAIAFIFSIVGGDAFVARQMADKVTLLAHGSFIPLVLAVIAGLACLEMIVMCGRVGAAVYGRFALIACVVLVLAPWLSAAGLFGSGPYERAAFHLQLELTAACFVGVGVVAVFKKDVANGLTNMAATWLVIGYAGLLPSFLTMLRADGHLVGESGAWLLLTVLLVCKVSDIGAYFFGSFFGRHKLIPAVSPGKSIEGFFGGIAASCLLSLAFLHLYHLTDLSDAAVETMTAKARFAHLGHAMTGMYENISVPQAIIFGALMSIVGQLGDLVESIFKRSADTKDSAQILPGFGGILDMIDSPVAIAPLAWFLLTRVWAVL